MEKPNIAIVGVGATGTVLAAAILSKYPETVLVGHHPGAGDTLLSKGLRVSGAISCQSTVKNFTSQINSVPMPALRRPWRLPEAWVMISEKVMLNRPLLTL